MKKLKLLAGLLAAVTIMTTAVCAVNTEQTTVTTQVPSTEIATVHHNSYGHHRQTVRPRHHSSHHGYSGCYYYQHH